MEGKYVERLRKPGRRLVEERLFLRRGLFDTGVKIGPSSRLFSSTLFYKPRKGKPLQISEKGSIYANITRFKYAGGLDSSEREKVTNELHLAGSAKVAFVNNFMVFEQHPEGVGIGAGAIDKQIEWLLKRGTKAVFFYLPSDKITPVLASRGFKPTRVLENGRPLHMFADRKTLEATLKRIKEEIEEAKKLTRSSSRRAR